MFMEVSVSQLCCHTALESQWLRRETHISFLELQGDRILGQFSVRYPFVFPCLGPSVSWLQAGVSRPETLAGDEEEGERELAGFCSFSLSASVASSAEPVSPGLQLPLGRAIMAPRSCWMTLGLQLQ